MYSEDIYSSNMVDHSGLIIYSTLFVVLVIAGLLRIVFNNTASEYVHAE